MQPVVWSMDNKEIAKALGKAGGSKTLKKYGKKHFKKIANKRWEKQRMQKDNSPEDLQF